MEYQLLDDGETEAPFCEHCQSRIDPEDVECLNPDCQEAEVKKAKADWLEQQGDDKTNERKN